MPIHVAILRPPYLRLILAGRKTLESRLTRTACPPYRAVRTGERIFLKASGGPFMATAIAGRVESHGHLTPRRVGDLRHRLNHAVCGDDAYWQAKRDSRYATFIELHHVEPIDTGPAYPKSPYRAWFVLPDAAPSPPSRTFAGEGPDPVAEGRTPSDPDLRGRRSGLAMLQPETRNPELETSAPPLDVRLTDGAVRNRYVSVDGRPDFFPAGPFALVLPDGQTVHTELYRGQRIRWRGWGPCFDAHRVGPGDVVRFVPLAPGRYRVVLIAHRQR